MVASERAPFRFRPPEPPAGLVIRERLLDELRGRFERRVTVVQAGAGFGKTTLLAHAVAENRLDPLGVDVWLQLLELDRRRDHLLAGLHSSLDVAVGEESGGPGANDLVVELDRLIERTWALAPEQISFVLDDVHQLDGAESSATIADLVARLPTNAHLVLGSRTASPVSLRLLQARGEAELIDEESLGFNVDEQREFVRLRNLDIDESALPTWPAMAVLMSSVGHAASLEFLWEAVLDSIDDEHRRALAILVAFERVDDEIVEAALGRRVRAATLLSGLPLIERLGDEYRFHDLWRSALADLAQGEQWRRSLIAGARCLVDRGELVRGAQRFRDAGADDEVNAVVRLFASSPISTGLSGSVAEALIDCLPRRERNGAMAQYLHLVAVSSLYGDGVIADLQTIRGRARAADPELAALTVWREVQLLGDGDPGTLGDTARADLRRAADELAAEGHRLAEWALVLMSSHDAEQERDVERALDAASMFGSDDSDIAQLAFSSRMVALGHPERVPIALEQILADGVTNPVSAHAAWLRGDIEPGLAWSIVRDLPAAYSGRRLPNVQVPLLAVLTSVALAAGDVPGARALAEEALAESKSLQRRPAAFARMATAMVALADEGEAAAGDILASLTDDVPVGPWPSWAYIGALAPIRALVPETEWLDDIPFGRSVAAGAAAGAAIRQLRDHGDAGRARDLPWQLPDLLRAQVPAPLLTELALVAAPDEPSAAACLDAIPDRERWIRRALDHDQKVVRAAAKAAAAGSPIRPPYDLEITTFGDFGVRRSDGTEVSDRVRGGRVQQLIGRLLVDGDLPRSQLALSMWPDLPEKQAGANLRVTLSTLLDAVEPERLSGASWFVDGRDGRLNLIDDGVVADVRRFESCIDAARRAERASRLTVALDEHRRAFDLYRGPFLPQVTDADIEHERLRLDALAYNSGCRVAELLLARGEPEDALRVAVDAARIDPLAERARRIEVRCQLALGATSAARATAERLHELLVSEGLRPDRETEMLCERVGARTAT